MTTASYNAPLFGMIGDVQGVSPTSFVNPSQTGFIIPSALVPHSDSQSTATFSFPASGYNLFAGALPLPQSLGNTLWSFDGTKLVGMNTNPGGVQISFSTVAPVTLEFTVTTVCPVVDSVVTSTTGCFSCPMGFTVAIQTHSSCDDGSAVVEALSNQEISLYTPSVFLTQMPGLYLISLSSSTQSVSGTITLTYGKNSVGFSFAALLHEPPPLTQQELNQLEANLTSVNPDSSFVKWWDSFTGTGIVVKALGTAVVAIIVAFLITLVVVGSVYGYRKYKMDNYSYSAPSDEEPKLYQPQNAKNDLKKFLDTL